ncbi:TetR/AcrR family transcriptional regulator [Variovorax boronicumulans]|uniref:TetR/AcrR family transcriptional regulator n=2 Tax=Variovorax boronicumulans TaxID=436515 RepID=UPI001CBBA649|nr:TetR/AcrR family transcriptional regulator [Variovorax boronicumulans]
MTSTMSDKKTKPAHGAGERVQTPTRGRPAGDPEIKRKELLRAAASVIAREGYAKASLRTVAQYAGHSTGAVTYYFANKEELIVALLESAFDRFDAMLESVREKGDIRLLFEHWLQLNERNTRFWPATSELLAQGRYEPAFAEVIARRYAQFRKIQTSILKEAQEQGSVRCDIPADLLADQLSAMGDGWMLMYPVEPKRFTSKRIRALIDAIGVLIAPASGVQPAPGSRSANAG